MLRAPNNNKKKEAEIEEKQKKMWAGSQENVR